MQSGEGVCGCNFFSNRVSAKSIIAQHLPPLPEVPDTNSRAFGVGVGMEFCVVNQAASWLLPTTASALLSLLS